MTLILVSSGVVSTDAITIIYISGNIVFRVRGYYFSIEHTGKGQLWKFACKSDRN